MNRDWKQWFEGYAADWQAGRTEAVAARYGSEFMKVSPGRSKGYDNDRGLRDWLERVRNFHIRSGLERVEVVTVRDVPLGEDHVVVSVTWAVRFRGTGTQRIQFEISYLLSGSPEGDEPQERILSVISHQDQRAVMHRHGLL